jgi:hypothetical protein
MLDNIEYKDYPKFLGPTIKQILGPDELDV